MKRPAAPAAITPCRGSHIQRQDRRAPHRSSSTRSRSTGRCRRTALARMSRMLIATQPFAGMVRWPRWVARSKADSLLAGGQVASVKRIGIPQRWKTRRTGRWSTAGSHTSSDRGRAQRELARKLCSGSPRLRRRPGRRHDSLTGVTSMLLPACAAPTVQALATVRRRGRRCTKRRTKNEPRLAVP